MATRIKNMVVLLAVTVLVFSFSKTETHIINQPTTKVTQQITPVTPNKVHDNKSPLAPTTKANKTEPKTNKQFIKVALLLDTSNSMDGLIDQAKAQLWDIVNELAYAKYGEHKPHLQIALYEYGNNTLSGAEGYINQVLPFGNDLDNISKALFALNTNGGNEFCGQVIQTALHQLDWGNNPDDLKLIFIAGNEPFNQGKVHYKTATANAKEKNITVNTIFCGNYQQGINSYWKSGADLTQGNYMAINQDKATVYVASPFDDQILILNKQLNDTYVIYGKKGHRKMALQAEQDNNAANYSKANAVSRTISKSSHLYKNKSWDLIDAIDEGSLVIEAINEEDLPNELKGKSKTEIKQYIQQKKSERELIKTKIQKLNTKRKAYIAKQQHTSNNGLENAMTRALKEQAKKKNYIWE